jgi:hypothetical protein
MRRLSVLLALVAVLTTEVAITFARSGPLPPELQAVRAAVARFHSVDEALAAGYVQASPCEETGAGGMGIHFINPPLFAPGFDPASPEILLYAPRADGTLELVGVEYWQADADQDLTTSGDRPSLFGRGFDGPMAGHAQGMPIHYDLHVWVVERNPSGVFAQWNPAVNCP